MCGIVGYIGNRNATEFLLEGLRRLEYRGYDSAGIATLDDNTEFHITKAVGRIQNLADRLEETPAEGHIGIGHTRWATHGPPTEENAHPHAGGDDDIVIVHNGVIENYSSIRQRLIEEGFVFKSATDSEVVAHLIVSCLRKLDIDSFETATRDNLITAVKRAIAKLRGTYGLVILFKSHPDLMLAARLGSPLVVGVGKNEHFVASDASPLVGYTDRIVYLADHQIAVITANDLNVAHRDQGHIKHDIQVLDIDSNMVSLDDEYEHYMLKEIFEQPNSLRDAMRGRLSVDDATAMFGGLNLSPQQLRQVNRVILTACGTSWHAGLVGEYLIEEFARLPVEVEYASELRYRNPPVDNNTILFSITQSGETADTLAAQREMKRKGHATLALCNVVGSTIAQEADGGIYLHAGPEIGVASTKAYTSQVCVLTMLALYFGRIRNMSFGAGQRIIKALQEVPDKVQEALETNDAVKRVAEKYADCDNFLYLGRQYNFPTALEGALKLKEISYIHAEGYPAAEMKHGPIALVDDHTPSVFIMPHGNVYDKVMANLEEIKARGGPVIAIAGQGDNAVTELADDVIHIPVVEEFLQPIVSIIPLQLLAYHIALHRGCDVDKPRNLAKSVTVE
ncbi:MAG: glutamine--fructose-6-phosphate transaminase (isomerizing) [Planctomycetales bacterium]|nr:glutamine--fructose-6-phosphate transaminase (isomerizing) [Planctomycetales bacterium]